MNNLVWLLLFLNIFRFSSEDKLKKGFLKTHTVVETRHLTKLTTDDEGNIYVGGAGTVLHFDKDIQLLSNVTYNTLFDKKHSTIDNTKISLLHVIPKKRQLFVCGGFDNGLCYKHQTRNVTKFRRLDKNNVFNYIGKSSPVVVLPANNDCKRCIFVARTFRPGMPTDDLYFISTRKILKDNMSIAYDTIKYSQHLHSGLMIDTKRLQSIFLQPIYAFQTRQFTYILFLQQDPITLSVETRLGRICSNDRLYDSYVDIGLRCNKNHDIYDNVSTATFTSGSLYISASSTSNSKLTSGICSYSIQELDQFFTQTSERCFKFAKGWQPFWMTQTSKCTFNYRNAELAKKVDFCGVRTQHGISGEANLIKTQFYSTDGNITSMVALIQNNQSVVIVGTSKGVIKKITVEINTPLRPQEYLSLSVSNTKDVIEMSLVNETWLYFITGNNLSRFDVQSCSVHTSCKSCLKSQDPLGCNWCNDQCRHQEECDQNGFSSNTCPPVIKSIYPVNGSIDGGTMLTIEGYDFGSSTALTPRVTIGGSSCIIENWSSSRIRCVTTEVPSERQGFVEVISNDPATYSHRPYMIRGTSNTDNIFHFKPQVVTSYFPPYGPSYGGTVVTILGKNLNIGGTREITIGSTRCDIISLSPDEIKCETQKLFSDIRVINNDMPFQSSQLHYHVDDEDICSDVNWDFEYRPNPVVDDISPKTTFNSGGTWLTVFGSNLNSVAEPFFTFLNGSIVHKRCFVTSDGDEMMCKIPPKPKGSANEMKLHFILDGSEDVWNPCKTLVYEEDPIFYEFDEVNRTRVLEIDDGDSQLILEGVNLSSTFTSKDVIIMIGSSNCSVESLTDTKLTCKPLDNYQINGTTYPVQISVGNLEFSPGYVKYELLEEISLIWCLILPLPVIIIIIIIVIAIIRCRRSTVDTKDYITREKTMVFRIPDIVITDSSEGLRQSWNSLDDLDNKSTDRFTSSTLSLFEKDNLIIDRRHLEIEEEIGKGFFGCVYKGTYLNPESDAGTTRKEVAVKTLRKKVPDEKELNVFLEEALIMKDFCHENVLKLVGICLEEDALPLVILPYMKNGDLLTYIRNPKNTPTIKDLILFAVDIARGMEYLTRLKFVHRDLAARNCMLDANLHVKVADFGLTRDVYVQQYYSCKDVKARLPVKWMALESIQSGTFTTMSDVWSYGVLLWELLTRGVNPYPDVDAWDIQRYLMSGRRLPRPEYCPQELYVIMEKCWKTLTVCRPSFQNLVTDIPEMLSELEQREESFKLTYVNLEDNPSYHFRDEEKWQT